MTVVTQYEKAGVNIKAGECLVDRIKKVSPTIGGFAGIYRLDDTRSLVACTDGVGTKLEIGIAMERYEDLGQDLVAMNLNDLIVCGARPLFFLDYFATGRLDVDIAHRVIKGIIKSCQDHSCLLLGGETAEMPGFYDNNKFDLAGFAVGEVLNNSIIDGKKIKSGDLIFGFPSNGFHANGYSLIRKLLQTHNISLNSTIEGEKLGDYLTKPTKLYVNEILNLKSQIKIKGMAHITGGGLSNITRVLPENLIFEIEKNKIPTHPIMNYFQKLSAISDEEAYNVWNMGVGFVIIIDPSDSVNIKSLCPSCFEFGIVSNLNKTQKQ
ncbi:MAG: phosphoribosylformylglycinamidine cyclo-ligase [Spirobacillus cienkowskii]|jgi:phosphoribosylformylglycinamidine cyclo-ligase|uniref:Phosphoribosylformylglycinamidine cyclo-ligase n=1 Tax=Spirobacillus cienkowskii TaxID=495820 RepID=A0A369KXS5_9BACT|nr:MAG: phosphoribosylformylglycinamidine cyclo-ligase [Spirobacillus cienkowskii]